MAKRKGRGRSTTKPRTTSAPTPPASGYEPGTLGEWLEYLGADLSNSKWAPFWPPDAFAIGAALLRRTGGYVDLVNGSAPDDLKKLAGF